MIKDVFEETYFRILKESGYISGYVDIIKIIKYFDYDIIFDILDKELNDDDIILQINIKERKIIFNVEKYNEIDPINSKIVFAFAFAIIIDVFINVEIKKNIFNIKKINYLSILMASTRKEIIINYLLIILLPQTKENLKYIQTQKDKIMGNNDLNLDISEKKQLFRKIIMLNFQLPDNITKLILQNIKLL